MSKRTPIHTPAGHVFLDIKAIVARRHIPEGEFRTLEQAEATLEKHAGELILELKARVAGKILDQKEAVYPADWWSHFKHRWFKTALFRRVFGAPKWERVLVRAEATYPSIQVPNHKPFVQVTMKKENT